MDGKEGYCGIYEYWFGICCMFGVVGYKIKFGEVIFLVCKLIK